MNNQFAEITKKASKTFYTASLLFPKPVRNDVFILYSFVRIADDFVDAIPPELEEYKKYKRETLRAFDGKQESEHVIIAAFIGLAKRKHIPRRVIEEYFLGQEVAIKKKTFLSYAELQEFIYGVAEVIGIMMCYVLEIPKKAYSSAQLLGRAMQLVNIIRDIDEDQKNGYVYLPQEELKKFGLPNEVAATVVKNQKKEFGNFIHFQTERILRMISESKKGFRLIPKKYRLPIVVCAELYENVIKEIDKNPQVIFERKVKPSRVKIGMTVMKKILF